MLKSFLIFDIISGTVLRIIDNIQSVYNFLEILFFYHWLKIIFVFFLILIYLFYIYYNNKQGSNSNNSANNGYQPVFAYGGMMGNPNDDDDDKRSKSNNKGKPRNYSGISKRKKPQYDPIKIQEQVKKNLNNYNDYGIKCRGPIENHVHDCVKHKLDMERITGQKLDHTSLPDKLKGGEAFDMFHRQLFFKRVMNITRYLPKRKKN